MSIVCVAGMHRSGTSAVAKLLRDCGLDLGPLDELVPPDDFNQHGYWEHIRFVELNDDLLRALDAGWDHPPELPLRWRELAGLDQLLARAVEMVEGFSREPWGWKDPRNCLTLPFWRHVVPDLRVVLAIRNPLEVALSLRRRNFFSTAHSLSLWLDYNNRVEQATNPEDRIVVAYDSLLSDPTGELGRLIDFIGLEPDGYALKTAMAGVLPAARNHHIEDTALPGDVPSEVVELYFRLREEAACSVAAPFESGAAQGENPESSSGRAGWILGSELVLQDLSKSVDATARELAELRDELRITEAVASRQENLERALAGSQEQVSRALEALERRLAVAERSIASRPAREEVPDEPPTSNGATLTADHYRALVQRVVAAMEARTPPGAVLAVLSKGDDALLAVPGRRAWHFPCTEGGMYAGHYPGDGPSALAQLEALREQGAEFLVFPSTAKWWLSYYSDLHRHLLDIGPPIADDESCTIFALNRPQPGQSQPVVPEAYPAMVPQLRSLLEAVVPADATVAVISKGDESRWERKEMGPRRVLYVCHNHPSVRPGGAEQYALELYEAMREEPGWDPVLVAKAGPPMSSMGHNGGTIFSRVGADRNQLFAHTDGEAYDWLMGTSRSKELYTHHFRDLLLALRPDLVHFQHTLFFGYDLVRLVRRTLPEVPIVYTLHEYLPICHRDGQMLRTTDESPCLEPSPRNCHACFPDISPQTFFMRKRLIQSHLSFVDRFVAPSGFLADRFIDWGIPRERILVEDYGRRSGIARDDEQDPREIRDRFGFFGQLNAFKGVTVAMEAMRLLAEDGDLLGNRCERAHLWVYGANLEHQPGPFQRRFQSLLDADTAVTYAGSYQPADVARLMSAVDWVIVPSVWWENSPLVIQEAFAARRPVICSDIGGMAEKVTDGVNGIHFRAGDPRNLAAKLRWVIETPQLWERLRAGIPGAPAMTSHVAVLQLMYEELLEQRRPTPAIGAVMDASTSER